ncbi:FBD-associated F-box protein At2g26860-like [Vigna umbellata]|uniref:FBD-associated F-box protein At2g26860-like n=1 Tax=Vigna umbellata TaxID=87088 RepID=UPI001F5F8A20|nr:FBD-associated F-box protein At2g26860-like [Vigna umbellata]
MLTKLPDEIIVHILSFVDAKTAVQTSVLNKRYRYLWASLPVINFDGSLDEPTFFEHFVAMFLSYRDTSINIVKVNLECLYNLDAEYLVDTIVNYIIEHVIDTPSITTTVEVLTLDAYCYLSDLPKLSVCTSLTTLKLSNILSDTANFDIPSLKHLSLCDCQFVCELENPFDPFKGCVNLESLYFHSCSYSAQINTFKISTSHLSDLNVSGFTVNGMFQACCLFELQTPRLQYFKYTGSYLYRFSTEINLLFVEKIYIDIRCLAEDTNLLYSLIRLFEIMRRAKSISLSSEIIEVLSMFSNELEDKCSPFTRMETFELISDASSSSALPQDVKDYLFDCHNVLDNDLVVDSIIDHVTDTQSITTTIDVLTILAGCDVSNLPKLSVCTSLTTLKLSYICSEITNFDLPSLNHLYLYGCEFECESESPFDPFKGCVNLESLYLVLSIFSDELEDKCSPFTRMQTFDLICDTSSSSGMPQEEQNGKTNMF